MENKKSIAVVSNQLILKARYKLTAREQKLILFMVSRIKPEDENFHKQIVPFRELERVLNPERKKWGTLYKELNDTIIGLVGKKIIFDTESGYKGAISWVSAAVPLSKKDYGEPAMEFEFSSYMRPFLLELKKNFTKYEYVEIVSLKSEYAIRLYQILKAERDRQKKYKNVVTVTYSIKDLKEKLGIEDKYKEYKHFKVRVIKTAQNQLKENTSVSFDFKEIKNGRKVVSLNFSIYSNIPIQPVTELNLFNLPDFDENQLDDLGKKVYLQVKEWKITPKTVMDICKSKPQDFIFEMIEYTKKNIEGKKIKNPAGYFIKALQENWIDQEIIEKKAKEERVRIKREKAKKKKELGQQLAKILKEKQDAKRQIYDELIEENHEIVSIFLKETLTQMPFLKNYVNIGLSDIENYKKTKMLQANIDSKIEEKYPKKFEKVNKKYLPKINSFEQQIKELEN